jgi:hypothetical protein
MGDDSELTGITLHVPIHHVASFKLLLQQFPRLSYTVKGMIVQKFTITGAREDIEAFRPKLRDWQHDCESGDAW